MNATCVVCGGTTARGNHAFDVRIGRRTVAVPGEYERCTGACGEFYFAPGEMDAVMRHASDVIRSEENLLTPAAIKAFRVRAGLTQVQLEVLLGAGPKTVVRWEKGTVIQNGATDTLLRVIRDVPAAFQFLMRERNMIPKVMRQQ